ncbi:ribonuclease P protein component [Marinobacterium sp. LSUCC0821]|jgi:ribonuclease P protein component|uniref:ribonuclease P protein component n=1 Tax=Marinobacterium sp. LSUCC0821 TaxID=2668067 RepID=UPI0014523F96|nr:ribonuclease P protein component [Marinobacterium sp. LSUCC0821]QJD71858.1 ribonuclease P protein component [Marinobacterium sp. LSUCC0821]
MAEFEYPRQLRLLTGGDFKRVFDKADFKVSDNHLLILARKNKTEQPRIGFVLSKKNIRRAVNRNRIRRIIRESFRLNQHQLPQVDIVILARKGIDQLENPDVHKLISKSWNRLNKQAFKAQTSEKGKV